MVGNFYQLSPLQKRMGNEISHVLLQNKYLMSFSIFCLILLNSDYFKQLQSTADDHNK